MPTLETLLYGANPVILVVSADLVMAASLAEYTGIQVISFITDPPIFRSIAGHVITVDMCSSTPTCPCVIVAPKTAGDDCLSQLSRWWTGNGGDFLPPLELYEAGATIQQIGIASLRLLIGQSLEEAHRVSESLVDLSNQIMTLREQNEDANALISALAVSSSQTHERAPVVVCEPSNQFWGPEEAALGMSFDIPFNSFGLSHIDLHFRCDGNSIGSLRVRASGIEQDNKLGTWLVPYEKLAGWFSFCFPAVIAGHSHLLRLCIEWQTHSGSPPALSLSNQRVPALGSRTRFRTLMTLSPYRQCVCIDMCQGICSRPLIGSSPNSSHPTIWSELTMSRYPIPARVNTFETPGNIIY